MTFVFYPVRDGIVLDGPAVVVADGSAMSQDEAHAWCMRQNRDRATGTVRARADIKVCVGDVVGVDLDKERRWASVAEVAAPSIAAEVRPCSQLVVFRGRNTAAIVQDAISAGLVPTDHQLVVVCRLGDAMAEPGDISPGQFQIGDGEIVVVANGGTSAQLVPLVVALAQCALGMDLRSDDLTQDRLQRGPARGFSWRVYDVQRDGCTWLAGDRP